ncbi:NAD(P)-dependent oxidoreductase [Vibrio sp. JC009]|uniref:SDR family oxidoreductase n=1 Tax=Vibrio sp. JC009 TaxID=2912314 RepID=UPI0023AFCD53|nr:NAD(P)-dependent oxidoreductase [Vibrio sp. JC009]WED23440.1 NAD(P)-dependent oxidoreductase [Vibrio sp. JC009]
MKVAVFGASGLFGEEIADVFESRHEVIRFKDPSEGDVSKIYEIKTKLEAINPDLIINATGYRHPDNCKRHRDIAIAVNTLGPKNLALMATRLGSAFMQVSSDSVFSGDTKWPYSEFDTPDPNNVYGQSKYLAEKAIQSVCPNHYIVRVPMLFGFKGAAEENLMFQTWQNMKDGTLMEGATDQICNPTYTKDAAESMLKVAESGLFGIYHISNEGLGSRYDLLVEFARIAGLPHKSILTSNSESKYDKRSTYTAFNAIAFKNTFDVELDDWRTALRRMYEDYRYAKEN